LAGLPTLVNARFRLATYSLSSKYLALKELISVGLSDHEQKLLEQMERALATEDPKLASTLRTPGLRVRTPRNVFLALAAVLIGVSGLVAGVITQLPPLGILGFVAIVTGLSIVFTGTSTVGAIKNTKQPKQKNKSSFMQGLEERWDRRNNGF
jgi:hypothetical protein